MYTLLHYITTRKFIIWYSNIFMLYRPTVLGSQMGNVGAVSDHVWYCILLHVCCIWLCLVLYVVVSLLCLMLYVVVSLLCLIVFDVVCGCVIVVFDCVGVFWQLAKYKRKTFFPLLLPKNYPKMSIPQSIKGITFDVETQVSTTTRWLFTCPLRVSPLM